MNKQIVRQRSKGIVISSGLMITIGLICIYVGFNIHYSLVDHLNKNIEFINPKITDIFIGLYNSFSNPGVFWGTMAALMGSIARLIHEIKPTRKERT